MSCLRFIRLEENSQESMLWIPEKNIVIKESTQLVDGIGGQSWNGSLFLVSLFEHVFCWQEKQPLNCIELGSGSGLVGIALFRHYCEKIETLKVVVTDREADLCQINTNINCINTDDRLHVVPLSWGCEEETNSIQTMIPKPNLLIGCEIACLRKQQAALVETIRQLSNENTIFLVSFDELRQPNTNSAERELDEKLIDRLGLRKFVVASGKIKWQPLETTNYLDEWNRAIQSRRDDQLNITPKKVLQADIVTLNNVEDDDRTLFCQCHRQSNSCENNNNNNNNNNNFESNNIDEAGVEWDHQHIALYVSPQQCKECSHCNRILFQQFQINS